MRVSAAAAGWRGVALVAVLYIYFLIFAQFAFLARLAELGIGGNALKLVMAAMAAGGILFSLLVPRVSFIPDPARRLRVGLAASAIAALLTLLPLGAGTAAGVAFAIGAGLGVTTVTLVTHLRIWTGERRGVLYVGLGSGIAYLVCNVPAVFTANPRTQAELAAALCAAAFAIPLAPSSAPLKESRCARVVMPFALVLASFAALIWLDSAAFYIIQHNQSLKAGTWLGDAHLWANGALHFGAAAVAGLLLEGPAAPIILPLAFAALGLACVLLHHPALVLSASLFYPVGVSLYSVALVAYPSFLARADSVASRGRQAGWIYAIAGWAGSALGIGMGQNLGSVPVIFVVAAGLVVLAPACMALARSRPRELALLAAAAIAAFLLYRAQPETIAARALTPVERGRQVYISEGCISCHSQYVRPGSPDVLMWGPVVSLHDIHAQKPPLIGNRRQGPDLSEVGLRRSPLWLKAHLIRPAELSYRSPMPPFAFLFQDQRGDELVSYLASLRGTGEGQQLQRQAAWQPPPQAWESASTAAGQRVYQQDCATCHDEQGAARLHWLTAWRKLPETTAQLRTSVLSQSRSRLAQIARFGIPGTDMPGHEYLSDRDIASVALWLRNPKPPKSSTD